MRVRVAAGLVAAAASLAACGGTPSRQVANPVPTTPTAGACATTAVPTRLPADVPTTLPVPGGGSLLSDTTAGNGLHVVRFTTGLSLRQGVLFILDRYPAAGFVLGRGDAEATEADAPFSTQDGTLRGALRLTSSEPCATTWLLAFAQTAKGAVGPPIPTYKPTSQATPLPFG